MKIIQLAGSLALGALSVPAHADLISGAAEARDGDSLVVDGREVRLFGIDAPELAQTCQTEGKEWQCGREAKNNLEGLVSKKRVECISSGLDAYGRQLSVCMIGSLSLNATMVDYGLAVAYREYSSDYVANELRAKADRAGLWSSTFVLPSDYRQAQNPPEAKRPPRAATQSRQRTESTKVLGCVIKGNRNRKGQWIYHLPGMPYYDVTRAEEIFCSETQAQAAGYRRAIVR